MERKLAVGIIYLDSWQTAGVRVSDGRQVMTPVVEHETAIHT